MMFSYETLFRGFHTGRLVRKKMWRDTPHTPRAIGGSYENTDKFASESIGALYNEPCA